MTDKDQDETIYKEISEMCTLMVMDYLDTKFPDSRVVGCVSAGKALLMAGCVFVGNGLNIEKPDGPLSVATNALHQLRQFASTGN